MGKTYALCASFQHRTMHLLLDCKSVRSGWRRLVNLPQKEPGRWGSGLTAEKMKQCVWLRPETVVRIDFAQWTSGDHLRHPKFAALRDDKDPRRWLRRLDWSPTLHALAHRQ
jgi:ATP-dependent DNA ligase